MEIYERKKVNYEEIVKLVNIKMTNKRIDGCERQ